MNRDKWSIWLGTVCLGAAGLALAVPVVGWAGWLSIVFVVIALGSFIGVLVTGPIEPGKWQLRTRVTAALRPRRARKQQTRALPAPTVTDRWRFTTDVIRHPQLARIVQDGFSQPAYSRQIELTPHYVRVKAREAITDIVSPGNIRALTAVPPYIVNEYTGFAIADKAGNTIEETACQIMLDLSDRVLHLDGSQEEMSGLVDSGQQSGGLTSAAAEDPRKRLQGAGWRLALVRLGAGPAAMRAAGCLNQLFMLPDVRGIRAAPQSASAWASCR